MDTTVSIFALNSSLAAFGLLSANTLKNINNFSHTIAYTLQIDNGIYPKTADMEVTF